MSARDCKKRDACGTETAASYARYLDGSEGRLRSELLWRGLVPYLPPRGAAALDAGAGTGRLAVRLAARGLAVVALDTSAAMMMRIAARGRAVERVVGDITDAHAVCGGRSFDLVACHLALEYTGDPRAALGALARCLEPGGILSLAFRNAGGELLKHVVSGNFAQAHRVLEHRTFEADVLGATGVLLSEARVRSWLSRADLRVVAASGIRVLPIAVHAASLAQARELEHAASRERSLRSAARYIQLLCRKEAT